MVAMSGGVDSSVSALLLQQAGRSIAGMFMKNWEEDDRLGACPAEADAADAQAVADLLGIDLHRRNFAAEYWDRVFEDFLAEYRAGRTPNPDILCNREIKFKTFLEHATDLGAECIATGHYVRSDCRDGIHRLLRGRDDNKDQSYFLYTIGQEQLARTLFPGRRTAQARGPRRGRGCRRCRCTTRKTAPASASSVSVISVPSWRSTCRPNPARCARSTVRASADMPGSMYYTLGQRQGLGIGGLQGYPDEPWYVLHKDLADNVLYVGQGHDHPWLFSRRLRARQLSWVDGAPPAAGRRLTAKVRYRQDDQRCLVAGVRRRRTAAGVRPATTGRHRGTVRGAL